MPKPDSSPGRADSTPGKAGGASADNVVDALRDRMRRIESAPQPDHETASDRAHKGSAAATRADRRSPDNDHPDNDHPDNDHPGDPEAVARSIVLRRLTARAHTRSELERALARKQVPGDAAATVLDRMQEVGLVDDAAFAEAWVESRQQRRHLSRAALRRELTRKGVDADQADAALSVVDADDEYVAALDLAKRKLRTMAGLDAVATRRRLAGALGRRGFGAGLCWRVVTEALAERGDSGEGGVDESEGGLDEKAAR